MKLLVSTVLLLVATASPALAQNGTGLPASPEYALSAAGKAPSPQGSAGGTGGSRETVAKAGAPSADPEAAVNQPFMATGEDLKGAPAQFPASKTPE